MMAFTEGVADAEGEAEVEAEADGEASPGLLSVEGEASGVAPAVGEDETEEEEPADSDFCGPQAVAASATAVAIPSVRIMTLWRCMKRSPDFYVVYLGDASRAWRVALGRGMLRHCDKEPSAAFRGHAREVFYQPLRRRFYLWCCVVRHYGRRFIGMYEYLSSIPAVTGAMAC
ncbi:hypothetical protein [Streptomyces sp. NPDC096339]|uniref:hypothetical protein n=1 Tax=Streptomyces sp. NPDC096339 TaxID=3366086 RepID=UPI00380C559E